MERDVVCGMNVDPAKAAATSEYNGKTYYFCAKACKNKFDADPGKYAEVVARMAEQVLEEVVDPVCGMTISPADSVGEVEHGGHTYYFCNDSCLNGSRQTRSSSSGRSGRHASAPPADPEAEYTCPMHPEIRQKGPGSCPICGMALEPVNVSLDEQPNEELDDMTRRFRWSLALTLPILLVMVDEFVPGSRCTTHGIRRTGHC